MNERMKLLEAVAAAVTAMQFDGHYITPEVYDALDALPAQPQGETVTLAMWRNPVGGVLLSVAGTKDDHDAGRSWTRLGTVTLEVTP